MSASNAVGLSCAVVLIVYLVLALVFPERF
ncbi:potassium-transporting ATPase subunit F [Streptomyces sp. TS71-3]|nr:potassium-transporting ATPase subunit F [Streptomyces sp. TS71-3]